MLQGHLELGRCEHSKVNKPAPKKQEQECQEGDFWSTDEASPYGQHWCGHQDVAGPGHLRTVHQFNTARPKSLKQPMSQIPNRSSRDHCKGSACQATATIGEAQYSKITNADVSTCWASHIYRTVM
ncbi:hypothetical protein OsI_24080 [Oryza sativa Indica Group]|uniref:Uncharacterized protein n=2 Tax=Oryza sativa TaxID=4530 RepID=B9FQG2_ORYSJ|nr:hypothetical protein OsI_24080 [Oryza sativa Indica Group]EEE66204.1 hypothetical protein OsJ_22335 [Oryza sativa Japonica Group]